MVVSRLLLTFMAPFFFFKFMSGVRPSGRSAKKSEAALTSVSKTLETNEMSGRVTLAGSDTGLAFVFNLKWRLENEVTLAEGKCNLLGRRCCVCVTCDLISLGSKAVTLSACCIINVYIDTRVQFSPTLTDVQTTRHATPLFNLTSQIQLSF